MRNAKIIVGDVFRGLRGLPSRSVQCAITSPPYWGLRDYGTAKWEGGDEGCDHKAPSRFDYKLNPGLGPTGVQKQDSNAGSGQAAYREVCGKCGARRIDSQIGLEATPEEYVGKLVEVFREVRRVLRDDGTVWLNLGDSYASSAAGNTDATFSAKQASNRGNGLRRERSTVADGLKPKDLVGIPWRVAFALQANGWYLRQDIIWCISGGTWLYVRTQKGDMPMLVKDMARLDPATVRLWNGEKWTQLLGMSKSARRGDELEIVLRSGERISCTPTHQFPTMTGLVNVANLKVGDALMSCRLPEPKTQRDCAIDEDAAWFAGLYVAEGSRSGDTIQIAGHAKEGERWERVQRVAAKFGGSATMSEDGNNQSIRVYGKVLNAIIDELVTGRTSHDKGFAPVVWRYSDQFIAEMVDGYLSGDGHPDGNRSRLGFCQNYNLERDLRTACARLGYILTLNLSHTEYDGKRVPTFRGELRKKRSGHFNERDRNEIVEIRKARCREVYDIGVADEPNLFALASGVLTHNSKPNPMPESTKDRCTKAHEYIFLLAKNQKYYFDAGSVAEEAQYGKQHANKATSWGTNRKHPNKANVAAYAFKGNNSTCHRDADGGFTRNLRSVWTITTKPFKGAHFATFPPLLVEPMIEAGSKAGDTILDPFSGAGTTGLVALRRFRNFIGIELNPEYAEMSRERIANDNLLLNQVEVVHLLKGLVRPKRER